MKYTKFIVVGVCCSVLSSCALVQSALRLPGSLLGAVGRTAGFNINNEESKKTDVETRKEDEIKLY